MTQPLWYVRRNGKTTGPFPARQLRETFSLGQLDLKDEVSLDGQSWSKLRETDILDTEHKPVHVAADDDDAWRQEREKAKLRWISDTEGVPEIGEGPQMDDNVRLRRHEEETRTMLDDQSHKRPAFVAGLVMVLILILIGIGVWKGQTGDTKIVASLSGKVRNCAQPAAEGVIWSGCDKDDAVLKGVNLQNANLVGVHLERADLRGADLSYANLTSADLRGANLRSAILKGATLTQADLTGADLTGADLGFAVMNDAVLDGARMDGTSFRQTTWLDGHLCGEQSVGACQ
jgi:hypothetical protein